MAWDRILITIVSGIIPVLSVILLFKNVSKPWKWIALGGIIWGVINLLMFTFYILDWGTRLSGMVLPLYLVIQMVSVGFCMIMGMVSAK